MIRGERVDELHRLVVQTRVGRRAARRQTRRNEYPFEIANRGHIVQLAESTLVFACVFALF